jgi:hypothetical protein
MVYIETCRRYLIFICRYLYVYNVVSSCHAADVIAVSDFVPNPTNYVRIYGHSCFSYRCLHIFKICRKGWNKTLSLTYLHTKMFRDVKSGDHGGQAIVPPCPVQATNVQLIHNQFQQTDFTTLK